MALLQLVTDLSASDWVAAGVGPFGSGVGALVPRGFEAYARILHPALTRAGAPVRWDAIARWSGGVAHPMAQFEPLARRRPGRSTEPAPFYEAPPSGNMAQPLLGALCEILAGHTTTADRCWFGLWEGYGWVSGGVSVDALASPGSGKHEPIPPAFGRATTIVPRVRLPGRGYLLFEGPLAGIAEMGWWMDGRLVSPQSPNLFWPDDRAWFSATEIDLDSTFVGGSAALINEVLQDPRLEAWPSSPTDEVWATSDEINGLDGLDR